MDNAQKAIMIGVGLFITIIIISAVMLITSAGQDLMDQSMGELGDISQNLSAQLTSQYDGTVLTGSEVIGAVKSLYTKQGLAVAVKAQKGESATWANYGKKYYNGSSVDDKYADKTSATAVGKLSDPSSSSTYVPAAAKFSASIVKNNDVVVGVVFARQ